MHHPLCSLVYNKISCRIETVQVCLVLDLLTQSAVQFLQINCTLLRSHMNSELIQQGLPHLHKVPPSGLGVSGFYCPEYSSIQTHKP